MFSRSPHCSFHQRDFSFLLRSVRIYLCLYAGHRGDKNPIALSNQRNKSKIRISKSETNSETNKSQSGKIPKHRIREKLVWNFTYFGHLKLVRILDFVLRIFCSWRLCVFCARHSFADLFFIATVITSSDNRNPRIAVLHVVSLCRFAFPVTQTFRIGNKRICAGWPDIRCS